MVTAGSVGANTSAFLTSISSTAVQPCACESTQWGFWSAFNGANNSNGQLDVRGSGHSPALGRGRPDDCRATFRRPARPLTPATRSPISPTRPTSHLSRRRRVLDHGQFRNPHRRRDDHRPRRNELCRHGHGSRQPRRSASAPLTGNTGVGPQRSPARSSRAAHQHDPALRRDGRFAHPERDRRLPRKRDFRRAEAVKLA